MILHVVEAKYDRDYVIQVRFNDGAKGHVDLQDELYGDMFEPRRDLERFTAFKVDPELGAIVWENGADLAPEFLHGRLLVASE
ncbi:DUF2442 domain-containing protein [bacterium]|nr:DUF2442 domain-containing protein [bacterium]